MLLQERIEELNSGILNYTGNNIKLTGFLSGERLLDYLRDGLDCRFAVGVYPEEELNFAYIKDNGLFIIQQDGLDISKYEFSIIHSDTLRYRDEENKPKTKVYKIRYCPHSNKYNFRTQDNSILFNALDDLKHFLIKEYNYILDL